MIYKIIGLFVKKPIAIINNFLSGKKTYIAGVILLLQGIVCLMEHFNQGVISVDSIINLLKLDCWKTISAGLAMVGVRHAMDKK